MICTAYHQDTIVVLKTVDFVEEIATDLICNNAVQIFEDEITWCCRPCLRKDLTDCVLWPPVAVYISEERNESTCDTPDQIPDIECRYWVISVIESVHCGLDTDGFPIP